MTIKNLKLKSYDDDDYERDATQRRKYNMMNNLKQQLEWVKRQLEYISFSETYEPSLELKRGDIYEFDWGVNVNCEFSNRHYGVVLQDSKPQNPLVIICPLKTNRFGANPSSDVNLGIISDLSIERETLAVINQIRSLDKMRVYIRPIINGIVEKKLPFRLTQEQIEVLLNGVKSIILN